MVDTESSNLEHYGVKGMKWGVRKDRSGGKAGSRKTKKESRTRAKRQQASDRRRQLTDQDLDKYIERLSKEKKLKSLVDEDLRPGRTIAKKLLSESGQKVVKTAAVGSGLYVVKKGVENKFGSDAASYIPKPKK